jgi:hypothetical protein
MNVFAEASRVTARRGWGGELTLGGEMAPRRRRLAPGPLRLLCQPVLLAARPGQPNDITTWHFTDEWYDQNLGNAQPTLHFVTDTSLNGRGPWTPPAGVYP